MCATLNKELKNLANVLNDGIIVTLSWIKTCRHSALGWSHFRPLQDFFKINTWEILDLFLCHKRTQNKNKM